jgi:hypothetical protein
MKHNKQHRKENRQLAHELAEIDNEVGKLVAPAGKGIDLKPGPATDDFTRKLMDDERAFLHPEEWGIDLRPIVNKVLSPPADPEDLSDEEVQGYLRCMIDLIARYHLCLTCTNHLSDRELYRFIMTNVLTQPVGVGPNPRGEILYHECCPCDSEEYLVYYEDDMSRESLAAQFDLKLPEKRPLVSDRDTWIELLAEAYRFEPLPEADPEDC